jgi:hypothetical protein
MLLLGDQVYEPEFEFTGEYFARLQGIGALRLSGPGIFADQFVL